MNTDKKEFAVLAITRGGLLLGEKLAEELQCDVFPCKGKLKITIRQVWKNYRKIICIMAAGIVVRSIAPLMVDKYTDPAVVVCDEQGRFAISLVSGHIGGANELAQNVAKLLGGTAVITTASDVLGLTALDLWCRSLNLTVDPSTPLTDRMGKLIDHGSQRVYSDYPLPEMPSDLISTGNRQAADLIISSRMYGDTKNATRLYPRSLAVGIGCKKGVPVSVIEATVYKVFAEYSLAFHSIAVIASIDLKKEEQGLLDFAEKIGRPIVFYPKDELNLVKYADFSAKVFEVTGAKGVAEPAALLTAAVDTLLVKKQKGPGVTVAIAELASPFTAR
ncbi:MAG: cobalamin biosynthesis protein CbiG [Desulfobulbus propionicus]|nr:MAG: cobalamin biosynthesis protein CbiG [Desulfobulbus propionicus]